MIRVQLLIGGKKYEATNDLVNWEDVEISINVVFILNNYYMLQA